MTESIVGYKFGPFVIDLGERDLYRAGKPQNVEDQVFKLLVAFAINSQRTLSRNDLAEAAHLIPTYIENLVSKARRELKDHDWTIIQTRVGMGYRLVLDVTPIPKGGVEAALRGSQNDEAKGIRIRSEQSTHDTTKIRVSMAVLLSIRRDDHYILVSAIRRRQVKPFGGVYTYFEGAHPMFERLGFRPEGRNPSANDLRGFIDQSNLDEFVHWFNSGSDREGIECLKRELIEELSENGLGNVAKVIHDPKFELKWQVEEGPEVVPNADYLQFRMFDVYEFLPDDPEGLKITNMIWEGVENNSRIAIVTREEIIAGRTRSQMNIGTHTAYLIGRKKLWPDPPPPFGY